MIPQEELESAIARWKARQTGEEGGEGVPQPVAVPNSIDDEPMEPSYPAMVEVADDGARTPVPPTYGEFTNSESTANTRPRVPLEAYRPDGSPRGRKSPSSDVRGAAIPRGNDEPTMVPGGVADYMAETVDSGLVEIDGGDDDK